MAADLVSKIAQARRQQNNIFKVLKEKKNQPRILYAGKLSFKQKHDQ